MFVMHSREDGVDFSSRLSTLQEECASLEQSLLAVERDFRGITVDKLELLYVQLERYLKLVNEIVALRPLVIEDLSYNDVVLPFLRADVVTANAKTLMTFPARSHPNKAIRDACVDISKRISKLDIDLSQDKPVYLAIKSYKDTNFAGEEPELSAEKKKAIEDIMRAFTHEGLHLPDEVRGEVKRLKKEVGDLAVEFESNLDEDRTTFTKTRAELSGLPNSWFTDDKLVDSSSSNEGEHIYRLSVKYSDYFPVMDHCVSDDVRRQMFYAFNGRCEDTNHEILKQIIIRRQKIAQLLGYDNHADLCSEDRVIGSATKMGEFLASMNDRFNESNREEIANLTRIAREHTGNPEYVINLWDLRFYQRINQERLLDIDMDEVQNYFPIGKVVSGVLGLYEKLFGFKFTLVETDNKWADKVSYYEVHNFNHITNEMGDYVGGFYLDLFPREGKYGHAAIFELRYGCELGSVGLSGTRTDGCLAMLCNFPETGEIPFDEVETFLHEFGHIMHSIASSATNELSVHNGFHTATDFVEAPSQMLEHWAYDPRVLELLSSHKDTGEPLPAEISDKLRSSKAVNAAMHEKRQLSFSTADYRLHTMSIEELGSISLKEFYAEHESMITGLPRLSEPTGFLGTFGHLAGEYAAGYYGYMFSNVVAADLFESVFKDDPLSMENGRRYRDTILAPGASRDELSLVEEFLGRPYNIEAYLRDHGLSVVPTIVISAADGERVDAGVVVESAVTAGAGASEGSVEVVRVEAAEGATEEVVGAAVVEGVESSPSSQELDSERRSASNRLRV